MSDSNSQTHLTGDLLDSLRQRNPFTSNAASDPWSNRFPDIASINRQAFEEICSLIRHKTTDPQMSLAGLILGEAGMGKTHLLRRILRECQNQESPALFVFVKPLFDPRRPLHHLLQEIVLSLSKNNEGEQVFSQFERLVAEIIRDYVRYRVRHCPQDATPNNQRFLENFETNVFHIYTHSKKVHAGSMEIIEKEAVRYIHSQVPETSKRFLDVVFQYKTPEKRGLVRDWLKGDSLDEEDCQTLYVPPRAELSDDAREQEAREILLTLGALFTRYRLPMVICFDQLDNLIQPELVAGFASMIHLLVNDAASILPLAFIRADSWNERFMAMKGKDRAFIDRMESNKLLLTGCNRVDAKELLLRRIEPVFGAGTKETIAMERWFLPLLESKLTAEYYSPREVILLANRTIREAVGGASLKIPTVAENLAAEYKASYESVANDFDAWDPESEYLKKAAELFLKNQDDVLSCEPGGDKYTTWTGTLRQNGNEIPFACFINTSRHWQTVAATLDRCSGFLKKHPGGICTFITDARYGFSPGWKATNEKREDIESRGANVMVLDQATAVRWYGLVSLSWKIGSGDILLETDRGLVTATEKDLANFLRTKFPNHETEGLFQQLVAEKPVGKSSPDPEPPPMEEQPVEQLLVETSEAEEYLHKLIGALANFKLPVLPDGYINGPRFIRLKIIPVQEKGVTFAKIQKRDDDMKISLKLQNPPLIQAQSGYISVDVPRKSIKPLLLSPMIRDGAATRPDSDIAVPIGAEIDGKTYWLNMAEPTMSSILIGGTSGSGKSVLLQSIVLGIRLANPGVRTEFTLIDPKRVTFTKFPCEKLDAELIFDPQPALDRLKMLVDEMEQRYCLFESEKCCDIAGYNLAHPKRRLTRHVTVIDEFADLMVDKTSNKDLELAVQRLGQKGRAAGFHLILATQRPEARVISPLIKANLQVKIAMKVTSQANSNIILDQPGAECLIGNGDMLLGGNVKLTRLQGPWASQTDYDSV